VFSIVKSIQYFNENSVPVFEKLEDKFLKDPSDIASYVTKLTEELHKTGIRMIEETLGYLDQMLNESEVRKMTWIVDRHEPKQLITSLGSVNYSKTMFRDKEEGRDLYDLVLKDIQELATQALKDADAFYQRLSSRMERRYMADASQMKKERERLEARSREIDEMFLNLYTDKVKGILSEQRFVKLTATMEQEQEENQRRLQELMRMLQQSDAQESDVRTFIREIRRYATIQELDETVLNRLISKILVGEVKKVDGKKTQEVRIVYNFVGEVEK